MSNSNPWNLARQHWRCYAHLQALTMCVPGFCTVEARCHELEMTLICFERSLDAQHGFIRLHNHVLKYMLHSSIREAHLYLHILVVFLFSMTLINVNSIKLKNMQQTCKHHQWSHGNAVTLQLSLQVSASPLLPAHAQKKSLHLTWWC